MNKKEENIVQTELKKPHICDRIEKLNCIKVSIRTFKNNRDYALNYGLY